MFNKKKVDPTLKLLSGLMNEALRSGLHFDFLIVTWVDLMGISNDEVQNHLQHVFQGVNKVRK